MLTVPNSNSKDFPVGEKSSLSRLPKKEVKGANHNDNCKNGNHNSVNNKENEIRFTYSPTASMVDFTITYNEVILNDNNDNN
eukprot:Pgem_evm1s14600